MYGVRVALEMAAATDRGRVRPHNEDAVALDPQARFAILADGMGGHNAGEVASRIAVDVVAANLSSALYPRGAAPTLEELERLVAQQIGEAHRAVRDGAESDAACAGMGTTLVIAVWLDDGVTVGHVGDSRCYRLRQGSLEQLTHDHSLVQERIDQGVISEARARFSMARNVVTRAVGIDREVDGEVHSFETVAGDVYLLCSDGLTDMLVDADIERVIASDTGDLQSAANELVACANASGGRDNISVIVVRVPPTAESPA